MHASGFIQDLAVILGLAAIASVIFQHLRQPVVLGFLLAGLVAGPYTPPFSLVEDIEGIRVWADLGVVFLMFNLGLEFSVRKLIELGLGPLVTGGVETSIMFLLGLAAGSLLGWSTLESAFLGGIVTVSSTTIVIKSFDELKLKGSNFSRLALGVLVVEDLVGILLLVVFSTISRGGSISPVTLAGEALKLFVLVAVSLLLGTFLLVRLVDFLASRITDEILLLLVLGMCFGLVAVAMAVGYSAPLGAFVMGSILASSGQVHRIERLIGPLRDLFAAIFFISIGMLLDPRQIVSHWSSVLGLAVLVVVGKFLAVTAGARISRRSLRQGIQTALALGQIGEFSFIIAALGVSSGLMKPVLYPLAVAVSVLTTFTTPYMMTLAKRIGRA